MESPRPNPDQLLARIASEENKKRRGNFRLFFGMSAGVGKTYAMLKAARERMKEGVDVCIGIVETHGRIETQELTQGFSLVPRKKIEYRGTIQEEMDLDAILVRKPGLVLVDELAHSNIPGSRHEKRYQDVIEILESGIDVYSTMNVQHLETRADVVTLITAIPVKETVPDSLLDIADSIDLIDITPHALIQRLKEGKVYPGRMTQQALEYFFQESNLTALREIALRVTANKVEREMRDLRSLSSPHQLLVAVGPSPFSEKLIRTARRIVEDLEMSWVAAHVDTGKVLKSEEQNQLVKNLALAEEMGAETVTLHGADIAQTLQAYAQDHKIVQMIVGRPPPARGFARFFKKSKLIEELVRKNSNIDITILQQTEKQNIKPGPEERKLSFERMQVPWVTYLQAILAVTVTALGNYLVNPYLGYRAVGFVFLLLIILLSGLFRFSAVLLAAILSALIWNYFFIPPQGTFAIHAPEDFMMFLTYFAIASVSGFLTSQIRKNQKILKDREEKTRTLYEILKPMTLVQGTASLVQLALSKIESLFKAKCGILLSQNGQLEEKPAWGGLSLSDKDRAVATWSYQHGQMAGWSTDTLALSEVLCLALKSGENKLGVLIFKPEQNKKLNPDQENLLISITNQITIAIAKQKYDEETQEASLLKESEKLHQTLIHCVSHELRTPLTSIMGAATALQAQVDDVHFSSSLKILSDEIVSASERLNHVFENLLDVTRLESGTVKLKQEWFDFAELVHETINRRQKLLSQHKVVCDFSTEPVYFFGDFELMEHAIANILLNAAHYSPVLSVILVKLYRKDSNILLTISDEGSGIPQKFLPRIFEKFYRLPGSATGGLGLGLSISKNLIELHQGEIQVENNSDKGATFTLKFPVKEIPEPIRGFQ